MSGGEHAAAVVAHYDDRAASYDDSVMHRRLAEAVGEFVGGAGDVAGPVVDVATGTGLVLAALTREVGGPLVGVDLSPGMLAAARGRVARALLVRADAAALPMADGSVGLLTCVTGLHLFADPGAVAGEWARVVRPGGCVVTATFSGAVPVSSPAPGGGFVRNHGPFRTAEDMSATFAPHFAVRRTADWRHEDDGAGDHLLLCELLRRT